MDRGIVSVCFCRDSSEAINITQYGKPHVHCPCDKCKGRATWRMTAWRHMRAIRSADGRNATSKQSPYDVSHDHELEKIEFSDKEDFYEQSDQRASGDILPSVVPASDDSTLAQNEYTGDNHHVQNTNDPSQPVDSSISSVKAFVRDAVLRLLEMKEKLGCSERHFEELLDWGQQLHVSGNPDAQEHWPTTWNDVQTFLTTLGFVRPKQFWICLRPVHPCHYGLMEAQDELCPYCGEPGNIPYYYLSLTEKVKMWCSSPDMCKKMCAHWAEKEHWLPDEMKQGWGYDLKKELWDGTRFAELSYFWDPNATWILPVKCPFEGCANVVSAKQIIESPASHESNRIVTCKECGTSFNHFPSQVQGDPRNIAFCGHWDGWQPFSSPTRGCGAIEVSLATMSKSERCHTDEVYVVGFVPNYLIPNKRSDALDPFLEPLVRELEDGFISGINVNYAFAVEGIQPGPAVIRPLLLCWKGDHSGQCEVGKFIKCGKRGCRRCNLEAVWVPASNHYYYPGFRKQGRFPNAEKSILQHFQTIKDIEEEERSSVKKQKAKETGYTGLSILHRLHPLYGFSYDKDLVYDEMHVIPLNVIKHHLQFLLDNETREFDDINWAEVDAQLDSFPWTHEHRRGRIPKAISQRFGYWKAEELSRFAFPAAEVCLSGFLINPHKEILQCMCRISEFVVNHERNGWTYVEAQTFHEMCLRYGCLLEETYGINKCVITLHSLLHFFEDIQRFSSMDNYSCWTEERAVQSYIKKSNNHKNIEVTFAYSEARREFIKFRDRNNPMRLHIPRHEGWLEKAWAHSLASAKVLVELSCGTTDEARLVEGIIVGGYRLEEVSVQERTIISEGKDIPIDRIDRIAWTARSVWKPTHTLEGLLYRMGEFAMFMHPDLGDSVVELTQFMSLNVGNHSLVCCRAREFEYFENAPAFHRYVKPKQDEIIVEMGMISRKVILVDVSDEMDGTKYLVVDYMRRIFPVTPGTVVVPYYPEAHDMVNVKAAVAGEIWKAHVIRFSTLRKTVTAHFFIEHPTEPNNWIPERSPVQVIHFSSILSIACGHWAVHYSCWVDEE